MNIAWLDCSSGISGDMFLAALIDAGASLPTIKRKLSSLPLSGYKISTSQVTRNGVAAAKVDIKISKSAVEARRWKDVRRIINSSKLDKSVKEKGLAVFELLFEAEAAVHRTSIDTVHLHELGAVDCMIDILGTIIGLESLRIEKLMASPVNTGEGTVKTAHGIMPVPAPATIRLLQGIPCYSSGIPFELTTPTGAALLRGLAGSFGRMPAMIVEKVGYGAGTREISDTPNTLRILVGNDFCEAAADAKIAGDHVLVIETNIDDMNPQYYETVMNRLFAAGALDVYLENIIMKKSRPAIKLTVIAKSYDAAKIAKILFSETTTIGLRMHNTARITLNRTSIKIKTKFGDVRFKISGYEGKTITVTPEYEDIKTISEKTGIPLKTIASRLSRISIPQTTSE